MNIIYEYMEYMQVFTLLYSDFIKISILLLYKNWKMMEFNAL